jgi:hypothetical protein
MRFARVVKVPLRSVATAALFGVMVGLTVPAGFTQSTDPNPDSTHDNEKCPDNAVKCSEVTVTGMKWCPGEFDTCASTQSSSFWTCRPPAEITCVNSDKKYGHTLCKQAKCDDFDKTPCEYTVYHCK